MKRRKGNILDNSDEESDAGPQSADSDNKVNDSKPASKKKATARKQESHGTTDKQNDFDHGESSQLNSPQNATCDQSEDEDNPSDSDSGESSQLNSPQNATCDQSEDEDNPSDTDSDGDLTSDQDSFVTHFNVELKASENMTYENKKFQWPGIGKFVYMKPILQNVTCIEPSVKKTEITDFHTKKNLLSSLSSQFKKMSKTQMGLLNLISDYFDIIFMKRTHENSENLKFVYSLHILNHILKSRAKIIHHNSKLSKNPNEEFRDQGFTKTLSVVLAPFRHDCYRIVSHLTSLLPECAVMNRKRFETEYGPPPKRERMKKKPQDYDEIFDGNINEDFKIGLKIKNKSIALYSEFYSSDLIIASPLGLRQIIGAEGDKDRDFDFLSSVEILVIDRADVLMLQNPVNLLHVLKHFNLIPKESRDYNYFRIRVPIINGMAKYYRQTILFSSVENMWFEVMFKNHCFNYSGYLISGTDVKSPAIQHILVPVKMCFRWFDTNNLECEIEDRFNFFVNKVLPDYKDKSMSQTMIYIPSYFDFVRLRNYFRSSEISAVMICEYSQKGKIAQARDVFFKGHRHFMLYTERAHFYSRYHIKGIQHILFYQLPTYPGFFRELCNLLIDSNPRRQYEEKSCCVLVSKHDILQLKHIVGLNEVKHMFNSKKKIFVNYIDNK